jgi:proline iminopeptidase
MKTLYPEIMPYNSEMLKVSDLHTIYFEECGNPTGQPVVFLHGGPGGGTSPSYRRYFDPSKWRIILLDQRGCGKSTPFAELTENTTWELVRDIETLKNHLSISSWTIFGGSWGSTLALSYAISYPNSCDNLVLRGIFMLRQKEIDWFYQEGCSKIYPDAWEKFIAPIPVDERDNLVKAYYKKLTSKNESEKSEAARAWSVWEASTSKLIPDPKQIQDFGEDKFAIAFARIECHYFINHGFFDEENYLLNRIDKIRHLPCTIVQGRYDVVCPPESAWELSKAWPEANLKIVQDAGHSASEVGIINHLVNATDQIVKLKEIN